MRLAMIGTGYVGLVSAACFASMGRHVIAVDHNRKRVESLQQGEIPLFEPGLGELVAKGRKSGLLHFTDSLAYAIHDAEIILIAVGTPSQSNHAPDLRQIDGLLAELIPMLTQKQGRSLPLLVIKSTAPIGTVQRICSLLAQSNLASVEVATNPEFLREGQAVKDFLHPERIVIGAESTASRAHLRELYAPLLEQGAQLVMTGPETAELAKYAANTLLATRLAFINEIADLCEESGADIEDLLLTLRLDERIGPHFLRPGPGFGGSCLPKDTRSLAWQARARKRPARIIEATIESNRARIDGLARRVYTIMEPMKGKVIALLGLSFKANTDDLRESPSLILAPALLEQGASLHLFDPKARIGDAAISWGENARSFDDPYDAATQCDGAIIMTEWPVLCELDLNQLHKVMRHPLLFDFRAVIKPERAREAGIRLISIGRHET